jgi:tripartite-type tricarboxylate transporter receptor subunit TctC
LYNANILWLLPFMRDHVPWDPLRDFAPVTLAVSAPNLIVVHPSLPTRSIRELIALARARPGELNYASGNAGSSNDLGAELFKSMTGVKIVRIAYRGGGPALNDLIGGHLQLSFSTASAVTTHVKSGKLRALAVTSLQPSALLPDVPTVAASGLPGYEAVSTQGLLAPAGTPPAAINLLSQEIARLLARPEVKQRFLDAGAQTVGSTPEQFAATIKSEMLRWGKVIKDAGIRADD